ncbi:MAG: tetratricopeptide repeat protein [Planctomycetota bacterium]
MIFVSFQARTAFERSADWIAYSRQFLRGGPGELQTHGNVARLFLHPLADGLDLPLEPGRRFECSLVTSGIGPGLHEELIAWLDGALCAGLIDSIEVDDTTGYWTDRDRGVLERMHVKLLRQTDEALIQEHEGASVRTSTGLLSPEDLAAQVADLYRGDRLPKHFAWWSRERNGWLWLHIGRAFIEEWLSAEESEAVDPDLLRSAHWAMSRAHHSRVAPAETPRWLAALAEAHGDAARAKDLLHEALQHDPASSELHFRLGVAHWQLDELDQAWRSFDRAVRQDPGASRALFNRALAEARLGRPTDALRTLRSFLELEPSNLEGRTERAALLIEIDRGEAALPLLDGLIEEAPEASELHVLRGQALRISGRLHEAIEAFDRAEALGADDYDFHIERGEAHRSLGLPREALRDLKRAIVLEPNRPEAHLNAAMAYRALGEHERADEHERLGRRG